MYRHILLIQAIAEAIVEFFVCKLIFFDYMDKFDDDLSNDREHIILFFGTYLMFCLPYKVFGIIVLHSYSQFKLDLPISDGGEFVSKLQRANRSYLYDMEIEGSGTQSDFNYEIEPLIVRSGNQDDRGSHGSMGVKVL